MIKIEEEEDIDELILKSIKNQYKTAIEIAKELNVNEQRISNRLRKLRKQELLIFRQTDIKQRGVKPLEYKSILENKN